MYVKSLTCEPLRADLSAQMSLSNSLVQQGRFKEKETCQGSPDNIIWFEVGLQRTRRARLPSKPDQLLRALSNQVLKTTRNGDFCLSRQPISGLEHLHWTFSLLYPLIISLPQSVAIASCTVISKKCFYLTCNCPLNIWLWQLDSFPNLSLLEAKHTQTLSLCLVTLPWALSRLSVSPWWQSPGWDTVSQVLPHREEQGSLPYLLPVLCQCTGIAVQCLCLLLAQATKGCPQMICVLISMCFPLQSRKSGRLYNAEVCGEVCSLILAFFQVQVRKNTELLQGHLSFMSAWILSHFWSPIQTQYARLWQKASWDWERQHFLYWWGLQCLFGKTAASMEQGNQWEGNPWNLGLHSTIFKQFGT